jgi:hypothetical protein
MHSPQASIWTPKGRTAMVSVLTHESGSAGAEDPQSQVERWDDTDREVKRVMRRHGEEVQQLRNT